MNISAGKILISSPSLADPNFEKVVIFIAEHNKKGALGFVINNLFSRSFNELTAYKDASPLPLYDGGPIEKESLFFLHRRPDLIAGGTHVIDSIYLGGDFKQAVQHIKDNTLTKSELKLFIGYCGWDDGELEEEVAEGSWFIDSTTEETVFTPHVAMLWDQRYKAIK